ncbi:MAG TPA: glycosyltransferase family 2 protein [Verrucomicrobiae bacterium]|nr:glycosyltransferase family 2 protein [Verrucomicrobiae bacterium]
MALAEPSVSVIIPVRNEETYIEKCLVSLLAQTYPGARYEIIVVEGRSSDSSKPLVEAVCREHSNVRCIDNPAGIVPCAMNLGIRHAQGEIIIRADGHNTYPPDYIENCVQCLEQTGADNVGGPLLTIAADESLGARMVAAVLTSPFGVGDSRFRTTSMEGYVDTVPFGAFRRTLFDRIGMYNEKLVRNQDVDLNARIRRAGGMIYQTPKLTTEYHPVAGFWQFLALTFRTSQWHLFSFSENVRSLGARHFAPALFVVGLSSALVGSIFHTSVFLAVLALLVIYLTTGFVIINSGTKNNQRGMALVLPLACLCFHISYGLGTLAGARYLFSDPSSRPIRAGQEVA